MKLCTGSVYRTLWGYIAVGIWWYWPAGSVSVEGMYAFIYWTKWTSRQVLPMTYSLTDRLWKKRATQLLIKYKSGALVTQYVHCSFQSVLNRFLRHGLAVPTIWLTAEIIWPLLVASWVLSVSRFVHFLIDTRYASGVGYNHTWDLSRPAVAEIFSWCCNFL